MDLGQAVFILSRLILGAIASFLAILLWSRTRDLAWMLVIIGAIAAYVETIYTILNLFGIITESFSMEAKHLMSIMLSSLPTILLIAALLVMVIRKYRHR